jgi:S-adenosylmethionine:diacylglycerol 3-amino-3-carboxypropyl transferase
VDPQPAIIGQSFALLCCGWIAALGLKPGATVVTIASGDCNALAYLAAGPQAVHAIDLNGTHLAMLDHKTAALAHLSVLVLPTIS